MADLLKLEIIVTDNGQINVSGPIDNVAQCYGLLEIAKDIIRQRAATKAATTIQAPAERDVLQFGRH